MDTQNTTEHQGCQKEIAFGLIAAHPSFINKLATETNVFEDDSPIKRAPDISSWKTYKKKSRGCYIKTGLLMTIEITHTYKNFDYSEKSVMEIFLS